MLIVVLMLQMVDVGPTRDGRNTISLATCINYVSGKDLNFKLCKNINFFTDSYINTYIIK